VLCVVEDKEPFPSYIYIMYEYVTMRRMTSPGTRHRKRRAVAGLTIVLASYRCGRCQCFIISPMSRLSSRIVGGRAPRLRSGPRNAERNDEGDDPISRPQQQPQKQSQNNNVLSEFDDDVDWKEMDYEDMNDFFDAMEYPGDEYVDIDEDMLEEFDKETLLEILGLEDDGETITISDVDDDDSVDGSEQFADWQHLIASSDKTTGIKAQSTFRMPNKGFENLERALMRGVVPAEAGVGSGILPGDYGFDPLELSTKDYFKAIQNFILGLLPETKGSTTTTSSSGFMHDKENDEERPPALILRDLREAEIRHGRLAMLAATLWPLQEILDRIMIPDTFGSMTMIYGGPTLPLFPLIMTFFMLNLGFLDVYSSEIKVNESGDAFLPGECFWDPLCILEGAPDTMKRNMQEREILNGRAAMIAVASFIFEEMMTHRPIVEIPTNALLFEPAYQVPFIQQWLDMQFGNIDYSAYIDPIL